MMNDKQEAKISLSIVEFSDILDHAILGKLCVQVWLGHGDAMFLGLGKDISPPPTPSLSPTGRSYLRHHQPEYEIQTYLSDWTIRDNTNVLASSFDDPEATTKGIFLVGAKTIGWSLSPSWGLSVTFNGGRLFEIMPYKDRNNSSSDAWGLRDPDGFYSTIRLNGECYKEQGD